MSVDFSSYDMVIYRLLTIEYFQIEEELKSPSLSLLQTPVTLEFIQQFSWAKIETIIAQHMPMTRLFLGSFFGEDGKHERQVTFILL